MKNLIILSFYGSVCCFLYEHMRVQEVNTRKDQLVWLQQTQLPSQQIDTKI